MRILNNIFIFYKDGFLQMNLGKTLWLIIILKIFIMFAVIKPLFFPDLLNSKYETPFQKAQAVSENFLKKGKSLGSLSE